jgi:hypothetical protein
MNCQVLVCIRGIGRFFLSTKMYVLAGINTYLIVYAHIDLLEVGIGMYCVRMYWYLYVLMITVTFCPVQCRCDALMTKHDPNLAAGWWWAV